MLAIEKNDVELKIYLKATLIYYGDAATSALSEELTDEINTLWNEPEAIIAINNQYYTLVFDIKYIFNPQLTELEVLQNTEPQNNYFRIEEYSPINISWVDGVGSNTGYFLLSNLYKGSTTASHEFGHTIGLDHPVDLNYIGKGVPGIMYPRGTLVDREFQYDPTKNPGENGGTMHPMYRKVKQEDIDLLNIPQQINSGKMFLGGFTSVFHQKISPPAPTV